MEKEGKKELEQEQIQGEVLASSSQEGQPNEERHEEKAQPSERKPKRELTEEEKLRRNKMMVLGAAVIGCILILGWLFTSLNGSEDSVNGQNGFNTEMPDADQGSSNIADKSKAYEMDGVKKNQQERHDLGSYSMSETDSVSVSDEMNLMATSEPKNDEVSPAKQKVEQSAAACNELSQTLGNFYQPSEAAANEELKSRIAELEQKLATQTSTNSSTVDDQMALMEKSYQLAAKYMPTMQNGDGQVQYAGAGEQSSSSSQQGKTRKVSPVQQVTKTVVSALGGQCIDDEDDGGFTFQSFNTAVGAGGGVSRKNTISASVYGYLTVTDGQTVRLRLLEPMAVDERIIQKGSIIVGATKIQGERLCITITSIENGRMIIPVELSVYDTDGQEGIFIPNSMEVSAAKEVAANMCGSMGSSINISSDAKAQLASDIGKGLIQGTSQYVAKKMRTVKVHLKAGYQVLLYQKEN